MDPTADSLNAAVVFACFISPSHAHFPTFYTAAFLFNRYPFPILNDTIIPAAKRYYRRLNLMSSPLPTTALILFHHCAAYHDISYTHRNFSFPHDQLLKPSPAWIINLMVKLIFLGHLLV